mmetsp:Transcript_26257/g.52726  ORF Transcript_26257/g.52726 Transcript_26257/m.52726 type:complete len:319 (+) Transcript_26257:130-1086(+)
MNSLRGTKLSVTELTNHSLPKEFGNGPKPIPRPLQLRETRFIIRSALGHGSLHFFPFVCFAVRIHIVRTAAAAAAVCSSAAAAQGRVAAPSPSTSKRVLSAVGRGRGRRRRGRRDRPPSVPRWRGGGFAAAPLGARAARAPRVPPRQPGKLAGPAGGVRPHAPGGLRGDAAGQAVRVLEKLGGVVWGLRRSGRRRKPQVGGAGRQGHCAAQRGQAAGGAARRRSAVWERAGRHRVRPGANAKGVLAALLDQRGAVSRGGADGGAGAGRVESQDRQLLPGELVEGRGDEARDGRQRRLRLGAVHLLRHLGNPHGSAPQL